MRWSVDYKLQSQKASYRGSNQGKNGKDIPISIHELEYYDVPLTWTKQANPNRFEDWINAM